MFIDTLNQSAPGADENSSVDVGLILAAAKHLYTFLKGLVVFVHHSGKDNAKGLRGHSSLNGAMDLTLEVKKTQQGHSWKVQKSKDGDGAIEGWFDLPVCSICSDVSDYPETSCVVRPLVAVPKQFMQRPTGKHQKPVYDTLVSSLTDGPLTYEEALDVTKGALSGVTNNRATRAKEALAALISGGYFVLDDDHIKTTESDRRPTP